MASSDCVDTEAGEVVYLEENANGEQVIAIYYSNGWQDGSGRINLTTKDIENISKLLEK